jgi:ankyrin repeat protein
MEKAMWGDHMNSRILMAVAFLGFAALVQSFAQQEYADLTAAQVKDMLAKGQDPNATNPKMMGYTLLMEFAMVNPNADVFTTLINGGARPNTVVMDMTALMTAARYNRNPAVVAALLDAGADASYKSSTGKTAYYYAQQNPNMQDAPVMQRLAAAASGGAGAAQAAGPPPATLSNDLVASGTAQAVQDAINKGARPNDLALLTAAKRNPDGGVIVVLAKAGANAKVKDEASETPLHYAAERILNVDAINALIKAGADVNAPDFIGQTPLFKAAAKNPNPDIVAALLDAGANPALKDKMGQTAYDRAKDNPKLVGTAPYQRLSGGSTETIFDLARYASAPVVQAAISNGADVNTADATGMTPLMYASGQNRDTGVISALIKAGAKVDAVDPKGSTALLWATRNTVFTGDPYDAVTLLLKAGANANAVDSGGMTPLLWVTSRRGNWDAARTVTALLKAGANADAQVQAPGKAPSAVSPAGSNQAGSTQAASNTTGLFKLLQQASSAGGGNAGSAASVSSAPGAAPDNDEPFSMVPATGEVQYRAGLTPLMLAAAANGQPGTVSAVLSARPKLETADSVGMTALLWAAEKQWGDSGIIGLLLKAGCQVNAKDARGLTPLLWATKNGSGNPDVVSALVKAGAQVNAADKDGMSPLAWAAGKKGDLEVVGILLKAGAQVNAADKEGMTPLLYALTPSSANSDTDSSWAIAAALVQAGAKVNVADKQGMTPLMLVLRDVGVTDTVPPIVQILLKSGANANAKDRFFGMTPLLWLAKASGDHDKALRETLRQAGADPNAKDNSGNGEAYYIAQYNAGFAGAK